METDNRARAERLVFHAGGLTEIYRMGEVEDLLDRAGIWAVALVYPNVWMEEGHGGGGSEPYRMRVALVG